VVVKYIPSTLKEVKDVHNDDAKAMILLKRMLIQAMNAKGKVNKTQALYIIKYSYDSFECLLGHINRRFTVRCVEDWMCLQWFQRKGHLQDILHHVTVA